MRATRSTRPCPRALSVPSAYASRSASRAPRGRSDARGATACGMSALQLAPVPASRAAWRSRAARTSSRTAAEDARGGAVSISSSGRSTPTCRSMRSSSGPLSLLRWRLWSARGALARLVPAPARARVRRGDEHEAGRQQRRALPAHDRHLPVLERLAQRLQRRPRELRQLVEEQDAVMGQARLPRAGMRPAAHEAGRGDRVVRSAERPLGDEASAAAAQAGEAVDAGDLQRLVARQRRQDPAEPPRQHRLAGPRRADEQRVVAAGGGDRQRADRLQRARGRRAGPRRPASRASSGRGRRKLGRRVAAQDRRDAGEVAHARDGDPVDEPGLRRALARHDEPVEPVSPRALGDGERAAARAQLAAEGQLAEDRPAVDALRGHLAAGDEQAARGREVVAGPRLRQVRGREVDRDAPVRELEAGVADRGVHALARLAHGGVAAADDGEPGRPVRRSTSTVIRREARPSMAKVVRRASMCRIVERRRVARDTRSVTNLRRLRDEIATAESRDEVVAGSSPSRGPVRRTEI